jgi:hypothetical protein
VGGAPGGVENMSDHYFVSCQDAGKTALLLGPFTNEKDCAQYAYIDEDKGNTEKHIDLLRALEDIDNKAHWYSYGMVKIPLAEMCPFNYKGVLNKANPEKWNGVLS